MPTSEAHIPTARASRYLTQLCRHAGQMTRLRHRPPAPRHDTVHRSPEVHHVGHSDTHGTVRFATGQWTLRATSTTLTLRVEADDEETLRRLQNGIAARLRKIGRRDQLTVTWQRPEEPPEAPAAVPPGEEARKASAPRTGAGTRRTRGRTVVLATVVILVVALHLGPGGAALTTSTWTGWATNGILALVALKLALMAGHVILGRVGIRHGKTFAARRKPRHPASTPLCAPPPTPASTTPAHEERT